MCFIIWVIKDDTSFPGSLVQCPTFMSNGDVGIKTCLIKKHDSRSRLYCELYREQSLTNVLALFRNNVCVLSYILHCVTSDIEFPETCNPFNGFLAGSTLNCNSHVQFVFNRVPYDPAHSGGGMHNEDVPLHSNVMPILVAAQCY